MALDALAQPAILDAVPPVGAALVFDLGPGIDPRPGLTALRAEPADGCVVLGIGAPLALAMRAEVEGLRGFTRATSGGYYFCPPMANGRVDLRSVGLPL